MRREIAESLEKNRHEMEERLQLTKNFDLVERKLKVGDRDACLYFVDGFVKDEVLEKLMEFFQSLKPELLLENGKAFSGIFVPYVEVDILNSFEELTTQLLSGVACLLIDGIPCCVAVDCRTYPMRSVEEPEKDKVLRGSRDGFVETLVHAGARQQRLVALKDQRQLAQLAALGAAVPGQLCQLCAGKPGTLQLVDGLGRHLAEGCAAAVAVVVMHIVLQFFQCAAYQHGPACVRKGLYRRAALSGEDALGQTGKGKAFHHAGKRIAQFPVDAALCAGGELFRHQQDAVPARLGPSTDAGIEQRRFAAAGAA